MKTARSHPAIFFAGATLFLLCSHPLVGRDSVEAGETLLLAAAPPSQLDGVSPYQGGSAMDTTVIKSVVEDFHKAVAAGKPDEVMSLIQPDALIVEGGAVETRAEYESAHLGEDITYARAVPAKQLNVVVRKEGNVAWVTSTFSLTGTFQGKPVDSVAAETMVLTKIPVGWRIRAIHWSSHKAPKS